MAYEKIMAKLFESSWLLSEDWLKKILVIAQRKNDFEAFLRENSALDSKGGNKLNGDWASESYIRDNVGVIPLDGPIFPKANLMSQLSGATSLEMFAKDFAELEANDAVDTIAYHVDSPGGVVTGVAEQAEYIRNSKKRTVAYVTGTGASAAYWLAAAADEVVLSPTAVVGSIGVVKMFQKGEGDKEVVEFVNTASPLKRAGPESKEGKKAIMDEVNAIAGVFIDSVAEYRQVSSDTVINKFGKGGVLVGQDAVAVGMADKVDTFENLMSNLVNEGGVPMPKLTDVTAGDLKKENPKLYAAIVAEGATQVDTLKAEYEGKLDSATAKIADLETKLEGSSASNDDLSTRLKNLEKKDAIREAQAAQAKIKTTADAIVVEKLAKSDIPETLHGKVRSYISHDSCVKDGVLDVDAFATVVDAEVKDWTESLGSVESSVQGFGAGDTDISEAEEAKVDAAVDSLLAHLN